MHVWTNLWLYTCYTRTLNSEFAAAAIGSYPRRLSNVNSHMSRRMHVLSYASPNRLPLLSPPLARIQRYIHTHRALHNVTRPHAQSGPEPRISLSHKIAPIKAALRLSNGIPGNGLHSMVPFVHANHLQLVILRRAMINFLVLHHHRLKHGL